MFSLILFTTLYIAAHPKSLDVCSPWRDDAMLLVLISTRLVVKQLIEMFLLNLLECECQSVD